MTNLKIRGHVQIMDHTIRRDLIDVSTSGQSLITRLIAGSGVGISSTGADSGTGDVTITCSGSGGGVSTDTPERVVITTPSGDITTSAILHFRNNNIIFVDDGNSDPYYGYGTYGIISKTESPHGRPGHGFIYFGDDPYAPYIATFRSRGSSNSPLQTISGDKLIRFLGRGRTDSWWPNIQAEVAAEVTEPTTTSGQGARWAFYSTPNQSTSRVRSLEIYPDGITLPQYSPSSGDGLLYDGSRFVPSSIRAENVYITDSGNHYSSNTVEGALEEIYSSTVSKFDIYAGEPSSPIEGQTIIDSIAGQVKVYFNSAWHVLHTLVTAVANYAFQNGDNYVFQNGDSFIFN